MASHKWRVLEKIKRAIDDQPRISGEEKKGNRWEYICLAPFFQTINAFF